MNHRAYTANGTAETVGKTPEATRWDPRQESIYFLLTARWFDGDSSNSIGDENCSWTEARANDNIPSSEDGFIVN